MDSPSINCSRCNTPLPDPLLNSGARGHCPTCGAAVQAVVFPAFHRGIARGHAGETILVEGEASCFYHAQKRATVPCDECGRFLCAVCDIDFAGRHICPACLRDFQAKAGHTELVQNRMLYDSLALNIALLSIIGFCVWPLWIVTGPLAIFLGIFSWKQPSSLVSRTRIRAAFAVVLGLLLTLGSVGIWIGIIRS